MGWQELLQQKEEQIIAPWVGGRRLHSYDRSWSIEDELPEEHGWYTLSCFSRKARFRGRAEPPLDALRDMVSGFLVGDRLIPEGVARVGRNLAEVVRRFERAHLIEPGLDRFTRIAAGRFYEGGPLIFSSVDLPLGPEDEVLQRFLDRETTLDGVSEVVPALDLAFCIETWRRAETDRIRREKEDRQRREEQRNRIIAQLGTGAGRRQIAREDFAEGAKAALRVGGAEYLDHRDAPVEGERIVRFRLDGGRFECVVSKTLQVIDAGICLTAHHDDPDFAGGTRGDTWLTLESLPSVIREARAQGRLVVFRHVN